MEGLIIIISVVFIGGFVFGVFRMCFLEDILERIAIKKLHKLLDLKEKTDNYYKKLSTIVNHIIVADGLYNIKIKKSKWGKGWFVKCKRYRHIPCSEQSPIPVNVYFPSSGIINSCGEAYFPKYYLSSKKEAIELQRKILESQLDYILSKRSSDIFIED